MRWSGFLAVGSLIMATACSNTVPLSYTPPASVSQGNVHSVSSVAVTDLRHEPDPSWYGAVRGGYGNPLKVLHTNGPVSGDVARAFRDALRSRGLLAADQDKQYEVNISIVQFEATQLARREANVKFSLTVTNKAGEVVYNDTAGIDKVNGYVLALDVGVFGSTTDLHDLMVQAMDEAIDQLLSKSAFVSILRSPARGA